MIIHNLLKKHQMMEIIEWSRSGSFIQLKQERTKKKTVLIDLRQPDRINLSAIIDLLLQVH